MRREDSLGSTACIGPGRGGAVRSTSLRALACLWLLGAVSQAEEIGPTELGAEADVARAAVREVAREIREDARTWILAESEKRQASLTGFAEVVRRLVPGAGGLPALADLPDHDSLAPAEQARLTKYAGRLARAAEQLDEAGLGGAAGDLAYLAWRIDDTCAPAASLLGYVADGEAFRHPRALALRGVAAPSEAPDARSAATAWEHRHVLSRPFVELHTTLPRAEVETWVGRVDAVVEWMRARFLRVPGYVEPPWPLEVRIYASPEEATENGDRPPSPFAYWLEHGVVNAAAFGPSTMPMENVVQHELAHGFLREAFPAASGGAVYSGWMTEAFSQWIYAASAAHPNDTRFWWVAERWLGPVLTELGAGGDVLASLRRMSYAQGRTSPLAAAGAVLCDHCAADPLRWEGFARFTARYASYREQRADFERLLGPSKSVSAALGRWARERTAHFDWGTTPRASEAAPAVPARASNAAAPAGERASPEYGPVFRDRAASEWARRLGPDDERLANQTQLRQAGAEAVPVLLAILREASGRARVIAASLLGRVRPMSEDVVLALLAAVETGDHSLMCNALACFTFRPPPDARIVEAMVDLLEDDYYDYRIRAADVLAALGETARPVGFDALKRHLSSERDPAARIKMAWALWKMGESPEAMLPIVTAELEADRPQREYAIRIVGGFGAAAEPAIPRLLQLATDEDWGIRSSVALALGRIGIGSAEVRAVLRTLSDDGQREVVQSARRAFKKLR